MKHAQFDYVNHFHCLAGGCPDTCCKDWQIILDEDALARYRAMPGPLGEQVRAALVTENGETRFREEGGRCVLLRDDGLCPIQAAYGAEALCRTCYTHPRFTEEYGQTAELTLSLSCPEAARLLLSRTEKVTLRGAVSKAPPRETVELLLFRQKLLDAAQDRRLTLGGRMRKILTLAGASLPRRTARAWAAFFASLEPLEPGWTEALAKLAEPVDFAGFHAVSAAWETEYEQLLVYFLLRHLLADEGRALPARAAFAVLSTAMLYALGAAVRTENGTVGFGERVELARLWSANVEYSEENMRAALDGLT